MSDRRILGIRRPSAVVEAYLTDGEHVLFDEPPLVAAWWLNRGAEYGVAIVLLVMIGTARSSAVTGVGLLMLLGLVVWLASQFLQYEFTRYVLTDYRALRVSGVLRRDYEWMSWQKVSDVSVHRSMLDRLMGTAHVHIQSANEQSEFKAISDVPFPNDFADLILRLVQRSHDPITGVEAYRRVRRARPWRSGGT